jgi:hypothetical protein
MKHIDEKWLGKFKDEPVVLGLVLQWMECAFFFL